MGWIKSIFSKKTASVIDSTGNAIDKIFTNEEERIQAKTAFEHGIKQLENEMVQEVNKHIQTLEKERTDRHANDMKSDSWLSKNVRPMTLIFMTFIVTLLAFSTIFGVLSEKQAEVAMGWIPFFQSVMLTLYGFYFGARTWEKVSKIKKDK